MLHRVPSWLPRLLVVLSIGVSGYFACSVLANYIFNQKYTIKNAEDYTGTILISWYRGIGEQEMLERFKIAAAKLGWNIRVVTNRPKFYFRWFIPDPIRRASQIAKPDFILAIQDCIDYSEGVPNYLTLTNGIDKYIGNDQQGEYLLDKSHADFNVIFPTFFDKNKLQAALERAGKNSAAVGFHWYPTANETTLTPMGANKLFYSGGYLWDTTRSSDKYRQFFSLLDKTGYLEISGPKKKWRHTPHSTVGLIPIDGVSLIKSQHAAGVSLLLHTKLHLDGGAPTGRIFEAASANTVIISDKHPFIIEHFGDNVLYIDTQQTGVEIFRQIDKHMRWIKNNPERAKEMANNCHTIFMQKFTLERQLERLISFHKQLIKLANTG